MRFRVDLQLEKDLIPKDKNRIILSIIKKCFKSCSVTYFNDLYEKELNKSKNFTFSLYMGKCEFLRDEIHIPNKRITLNFSTVGYEDGVMFFNSFLSNQGKSFVIKENSITIGKVNLVTEKNIYNNEVTFKTMSPIVVREHSGDNKKTWYHSLNTNAGYSIFMTNIKHQLYNVFGEQVQSDLDDIQIEVSPNNKQVKVKNYGIEVLSNVGLIKVKSAPYILEYLYKAGIGSKRGVGFGMVDIV